MHYSALLKRIIPFVLTFAAGLFLASFFVSIAFPGERWRSGRHNHRFYHKQQLRLENEDLREKNRLLRLENEELRKKAADWDVDAFIKEAVPPVDFEGHHHPPKRPERPRAKGTGYGYGSGSGY
jgi:hypothetical protein